MKLAHIVLPGPRFLDVPQIKCLFGVRGRPICHLRNLARRGPEVGPAAGRLVALSLGAAVRATLREEVLVSLGNTLGRLFAVSRYLLANCLVSARGNAVVFGIG